MKMSSPSLRQNAAKGSIRGRGNNIVEQRAHHRNAFISRLRSLRIREIDRYRHISEDELNYRCLVEIKKLLSNTDCAEEVNPQELQQILEDIDREIAAIQAEEYEQHSRQEAEALAECLMDRCLICNSLITEGTLCEQCFQVHFMSQLF